MSNCVVCKKEVNWTKVQEEFEHIFKQADRHGIESLTEHKQVICEGKCCSSECYSQLR